jgi:uncharacterized protein YheU (UPF0270 family)
MDYEPDDREAAPPVEIPHTALSPDVLRAVIESFVLREGTEYGERDVSLDRKVEDVLRQLERGEAQIIFDPNTESVDIVVKTRAKRSSV